MLWFFYNCIFTVVYICLLPHFFLRMWKRGGYRHGFLQRLGRYDAPLKARLTERRRIWIHAVSVGEIWVALQFMQEWRVAEPSAAFFLSTTTSTGHAIAEKHIGPEDVLLYFPMDWPSIVTRVLNLFQPPALILVEGELWPNLVRLARRRQIPVMLINGRVSVRSYRGYCKLRPLVRRILACYELCCVQGAEDARRLEDLGADPARVKVMGSAKYDAAESRSAAAVDVPGILRQAGFPENAALLVGGSTWPGEEAILLAIYKNLHALFHEARLILVPRHMERSHDVEAEIEKQGLTYVRRSGLRSGVSADRAPAEVLLVDTTGELSAFYAAAAVIFIGKSLTRHGGQNVIEAAALAKPIIVGPNMENFVSVMSDFLSARALIQVPDAAGLERAVFDLWQQADLRRTYGDRARQVVTAKAGVIRATVAACREICSTSGPGRDRIP